VLRDGGEKQLIFGNSDRPDSTGGSDKTFPDWAAVNKACSAVLNVLQGCVASEDKSNENRFFLDD